jgi:hypothetical protein
MKLILEIEGESFPLRCMPERAPVTMAHLLRVLPQRIDVHCPKIAGSHIYWPAPFVVGPETAQDVMRMPEGAFFFWPERQMLELAYAPLQPETASVTLLGACAGNLGALRRIGERVAAEQGVRTIFASLRAEQPAARAPEGPVPPGLAALQKRREALWRDIPPELIALMESRVTMHPAGPLFFAESEARGLHESLWWLCRRWRESRAVSWRQAAALAAEKAATRLGGFCHLAESAATLQAMQAAFLDPGVDGDTAFTEAILIAGRLSGWLDLLVPWHAVNEAVRAAAHRAHSMPVARSA